jgi:tetratricopeptide (TPR) repeat protein
VLLTTKPPEHVAEALGDALKPCDVDDYLTINDKMPPLSIYVAQLMPIRELNILAPFADTKTINDAGKTAKGLLARWRRRGLYDHEAFYALGLATLAAGAEVDGKTADLLLYTASFAVQRVTHPGTVLPVLAALRPLGERAPHRYVHLLAAASELETPYPETVWYIYDALQQLKSRLRAERLWSLVYVIHTYSNLLTKHSMHIMHRLEDAVVDMCQMYGEIGMRNAAAVPDSDSLAQRYLFNTIAKAFVLTAALRGGVLAPLVQRHCGLSDIVKEVEAVRSLLDWAAAHLDELKKIMENDAEFAEWGIAWSTTGDAMKIITNLMAWFTNKLAHYKLVHALNEKGELDEKKLEEIAEKFEKAAEIDKELGNWENYLASRSFALRARVLAAKSWEELLERAKGFWELWEGAKKHLEPTARYLATAANILGDCLVYLAASGDKRGAEELLKKWRWVLDYGPWVSVDTRLMLRLFGVGEGARLEEVVDVFGPWLSSEYRPALWLLAGYLQKDKALEICKQLSNAQQSKAKTCVNAVAAAAGDQETAERLKSEIESETLEMHSLLDKVDGRTLVEVLAPEYSHARLAFMLLAAVEGRAEAVRLHGLLSFAWTKEPLPRRLFRAVYENCSDLNSEGCRMALLKLYYLQF